nr:hypothetical protein [uncultured Neokomagataea sp.]
MLIEVISDTITSLLFSCASYRGEKVLHLHHKYCHLRRCLAWVALGLSLILHIDQSKTIGFALICWMFGTGIAFACNGAALGLIESFRGQKTVRRQ